MRGQRQITLEDLLQIPEVVAEPDVIELDERLYEGKPVLRFKKTLNGRTIVVTYVTRKHHDLSVQTMYGSIKKESLSTATDVQAPVLTSQTTRGTASESSILQTEETVKEETRYQLESGDESPAVQKLLRENARLKSAAENLRQQFRLTRGVQVRASDVEKLAAKVIRAYSSRADAHLSPYGMEGASEGTGHL